MVDGAIYSDGFAWPKLTKTAINLRGHQSHFHTAFVFSFSLFFLEMEMLMVMHLVKRSWKPHVGWRVCNTPQLLN